MAIPIEPVIAFLSALVGRIWSVVQVKKHVDKLSQKVTENGATLRDIKYNDLPHIKLDIEETKAGVIRLEEADKHFEKRVSKLEEKNGG